MDFIVSKLSLLAHCPLFIALIVLIVAVICRKMIWRLLKAINKKIERNLFIYALLVSTLSTVAIYYGIGHSSERWLYDIVRSVIAAMGMFVGKLDLSIISIKENEHYIALILVLYICSLLTTVKLLLKFVFFRFTSWVSLKWNKRHLSSKTINIFWGVNEASYMLASNIKEINSQEPNKQQTDQIIFVHTNDIRDNDNQETIGAGRILDLMSLQRKDIEKLEDIGALVANCHIDLAHIDVKKPCKESIFTLLELEDIKQIISQGNKIRIFFLSESEEKNILQAINIMQDSFICSLKDKLHIYIHARRSSKNEIYNQHSLYSASKIKVSVVDSSFLSVAHLKQEVKYHPVSVVDIDTDTATVNRPFNSMVIGFGETGIEAFKFMYEFGSFVTKTGTKTPFSCIAIDTKMEQIEGAVRTQMPAIGSAELQLCNLDIHSKEFWDKLTETIKSLNYIFITINDDAQALSLAIDIYKYAMKLREGKLKNFKIFVRAHTSDSARHMKDVEQKVNNAAMTESKVEQAEQCIVVFGTPEDIYTYDLIINETILLDAKLYHYNYAIAATEAAIAAAERAKAEVDKATTEEAKARAKAVAAAAQAEAEQMLAELQAAINASDDTEKPEDIYWKQYFGPKEGVQLCTAKINEISFKVEQNISNDLHIGTKMALLGIVNADGIGQYSDIIASRKAKTVYKTDTLASTRLLNVSKCEHERWNSATRLMGFVRGNEKNFITYTHKSLCSWSQIADEATQAYDCIVVEVSIDLFKNKLQTTKK